MQRVKTKYGMQSQDKRPQLSNFFIPLEIIGVMYCPIFKIYCAACHANTLLKNKLVLVKHISHFVIPVLNRISGFSEIVKRGITYNAK